MQYSLRILFSTLFVMACSTVAFSTIRVVDNNPANGNSYRTLQLALNASSAHDTIYMVGSQNNYGGGSVDIPIHIFGPGFLLTENPDSQARPLGAYVSTLYFRNSSTKSTVCGIYVYTLLDISVDSVEISRCYISSWDYNTISINCNQVTIKQCYLYRSYPYSSSYVLLQITRGNVLLLNNNIENRDVIPVAINMQTSAGPLEAYNNIITGNAVVYNGNFMNNVIRLGRWSGNSNTFFNNVCDSTQCPTGNGNLQLVNMSTVFNDTGTTENKLRLRIGSPAIGAGWGGTDCGIFGGPNQYIIAGLPPIPTITSFSGPAQGGTTSGLPVNIRARVRP